MVEAKDTGYKWQRQWQVPLARDGAGSVKLPAFRACDSSCHCVSFPRLVWDVRPAAQGGQQWNEDGDTCSDTSAQLAATSSCYGQDASRVQGSFASAASSEREANLAAGRLYSSYVNLHDFVLGSPAHESAITNRERRDEIWVTLGIFQRKYAPWLNVRCVQENLMGFIVDPMAARPDGMYEYWNAAEMFDDSADSFDYIAFARARRGGGASSGVNGGGGGGGTSSDLCSNTCIYASDSDCDDGGAGSAFSSCALGTDCVDCGARTTRRRAETVHATHGTRRELQTVQHTTLGADECQWPLGGFNGAYTEAGSWHGATNSRHLKAEPSGLTGAHESSWEIEDEPSEVAKELHGVHEGARRELGRGVGSGSAGSGRLQGCARHATCATRGSRAPPRRP